MNAFSKYIGRLLEESIFWTRKPGKQIVDTVFKNAPTLITDSPFSGSYLDHGRINPRPPISTKPKSIPKAPKR